MKIKKIIALSIIVTLLSIYLPFISNISMATTGTDYDFTDELETDRTGVGFKWTASTKTLEVTSIKNSNAELKLPEGTKVKMVGDSQNTVKYIYSKGAVSISGTEESKLTIAGGYVYYTAPDTTKYSSSIYVSSLNIESGNIRSAMINCSEDFKMDGGNVTASSSQNDTIKATKRGRSK